MRRARIVKARSSAEPLSDRELQVLRLAAAGATNVEIAARLFITPGTVKNHLTSILSKLGVRDRTQAALKAKELRLRSYSKSLEDLRNGVQAARAVHDPAKMLGLALAHAGLQAKVVQLAAYDMVAEPTERMRLRRDILKSMLAAGDIMLWEEALARSLDFEETTFRTFDWFGQSALKLQEEGKTFPPRLLDTIDWAEQLMRV